MSLSGTLEDLGLPDIVRLIGRSERTGLLRVSDGNMVGQLFLVEGRLTYATTRSEDSFLSDLLRMGLVDEGERAKLERRKADIGDVLRAKAKHEQLAEFVEEQMKEVLVRLLRLERGSFEFQEGVQPRYETGQAFDVEATLEKAEARLTEWQDIEEVIPGPAFPFRMAARLEDEHDEVTLDALAWSILSSLGAGASVQEVARRLGMWDYPAAKNLARLIRSGLVEPVDGSGRPKKSAERPAEVPEVEVVVEEEPEPEPVAAEEPEEPEELEEPEDRRDGRRLPESDPEDSEPVAEEEPEEEEPEEEEPAPEEDEEEPTSELMRRWKELRSRDGRSVG